MTDTNPDTPGDGEDILADAERIVNDAAEAGDEAADAATETAEAAADPLASAEAKAAEHLADLQRLQAEYVNYRKRVDRDRERAGEVATGRLVEALIPTLDDIHAAREHGDLGDGPFAAIATKLETALGQLGWSSYAAAGDEFDPALHEALMTQTDADATAATVTQVAQPGHKLGDRVIRAARVIVTQPE